MCRPELAEIMAYVQSLENWPAYLEREDKLGDLASIPRSDLYDPEMRISALGRAREQDVVDSLMGLSILDLERRISELEG